MNTIEDRITAGQLARDVLDNPEFQAAFAEIEQEITEQWKQSPARDAEGREKLHQYLLVLQKVKSHLNSRLETGKLALEEMKHRQSVREKITSWMR